MTDSGIETERERRKRLAEQYKKQPRDMGLYAIRNTVSGKMLVGVSVDLRARFNRHRMNLKFGTEDHQQLQQDWNTLGPEAFAFEVLEHLEPLDEPGYDAREELAALKDLWFEQQAAMDNVYYE